MATVPGNRAPEQAGGTPALGKNAKSVGHRSSEALFLDRRRLRWERRQTYQRLLDHFAASAGGWESVPGRRQASCGRCAHAEDVELRGRIVDDGATAYPVGVVTCASVWACPVCMAKVMARRSIEVEAAALSWSAAGGSMAMLTLTVRHHRTHSLAELRRQLKRSWRALQNVRWWRELRASMGGLIVRTEVTWGPNGWHPHLHVLLFVTAGVDVGQVLDEIATKTPAAWRSIVGAKFEVAPSLAHGVRVQRLDAGASQYVSKLADEATRSDLKSNATNPFALLDAVADGEAQAVAMWVEYCSAMKGARALVWSRGLRELVLPDVDELTDDELAAIDVDGELLDVLPAPAWLAMCRRKNGRGIVEALAHLEQLEAKLLDEHVGDRWWLVPDG